MRRFKVKADYLIASALMILWTINAQSQLWVPGTDDLLNKLRTDKNVASLEKISYTDIDGDPFLYRDFAQGKVILKNGESYNVYMRYDIYADQVQFKKNEQVFSFIAPENISAMIIDTLTFLYSDLMNSPQDKSIGGHSYFILKTDGKCKLLVKKNIRLQAAEPPKIYQDARPPSFILTADTYFLKKENDPAIRVKNKKEILDILNDRRDKVGKFIEANRLGTRDLNDLEKIVSYYNGL